MWGTQGHRNPGRRAEGSDFTPHSRNVGKAGKLREHQPGRCQRVAETAHPSHGCPVPGLLRSRPQDKDSGTSSSSGRWPQSRSTAGNAGSKTRNQEGQMRNVRLRRSVHGSRPCGPSLGQPTGGLRCAPTKSHLIGGVCCPVGKTGTLCCGPGQEQDLGLRHTARVSSLARVCRWQVLGRASGLLSAALSGLLANANSGRRSTGCSGAGVPAPGAGVGMCGAGPAGPWLASWLRRSP